jgi:hypothetical protein
VIIVKHRLALLASILALAVLTAAPAQAAQTRDSGSAVAVNRTDSPEVAASTAASTGCYAQKPYIAAYSGRVWGQFTYTCPRNYYKLAVISAKLSRAGAETHQVGVRYCYNTWHCSSPLLSLSNPAGSQSWTMGGCGQVSKPYDGWPLPPIDTKCNSSTLTA